MSDLSRKVKGQSCFPGLWDLFIAIVSTSKYIDLSFNSFLIYFSIFQFFPIQMHSKFDLDAK